MLTELELFMIRIIEMMVLINIYQLSILSGKKSISATRKAVNKLIKKGYVTTFNMGNHLVYTCTQKTLTLLGKNRRPYRVKGYSSEHIESITSVMCYFYIKFNISPFDMILDNDIKLIDRFKSDRTRNDGKVIKNVPDHVPDAIIAPNLCVEIELNAKQHSRLERNFKDNNKNFSKQCWIIPERLTALKKNLFRLAKENNADISIYPAFP